MRAWTASRAARTAPAITRRYGQRCGDIEGLRFGCAGSGGRLLCQGRIMWRRVKMLRGVGRAAGVRNRNA